MRRVYEFCAENKVEWYAVIELNEVFQKIIEDAIQAGLDEVARQGLWDIKYVLERQLEKNVPLENEIWMFHIGEKERSDAPVDHDKSLQWQNITHTYLGILDHLSEKAIEFKRTQLVYAALRNFTDIISHVADTKLGDKQKAEVISWCGYYAKSLTIKCADKKLYGEALSLSPFHFLSLDKVLDKKAGYSRKPLLVFCETLVELGTERGLRRFRIS